MKVLIADQFEQVGIDGITAAGCEVIYQPALADEQLAGALASMKADVLVVRSTKVTDAMLANASLSLIVRAGAGVNTIDVNAASRRGIYVSNCPGKNAIAVAELTFALILALDRRIAENVIDLRAGKWNKKEYSKAKGLFGRTLGIIGYGSIGQEVAQRAKAFGMPVVAWSRRFGRGSGIGDQGSRTAADPYPLHSPEDVAERSDVLSIHLALASGTRHFIGASILNRLKPGSYFINTSRGEIVDHAALADAIRNRGIRAARGGKLLEQVQAAVIPAVDPRHQRGTRRRRLAFNEVDLHQIESGLRPHHAELATTGAAQRLMYGKPGAVPIAAAAAGRRR